MPNGFQTSQSVSNVRHLPSKDVNDHSIDNAYVQFILYCNPYIATDVDTAELRRGFRAPPKSDGKSFSPFVLFGLLTRLEKKDIKTWRSVMFGAVFNNLAPVLEPKDVSSPHP